MGCDIHLYVERFINDKWVYIVPPEIKDKDDIHELGWYHNYEEDYTIIPWNQNRNYDLFAMLADVRNGRGFAGCDTGDGFIPISMPKRLPKDVCDEIKKESDGWGVDGHSHSYLTLKEIQSYDFQQVTKHRGWVDVNGYIEFKKTGNPSSCYGGVEGPGVSHISIKKMEELIATDNPELAKDCYCKIEWEQKYEDSLDSLFKKLLEEMAKIESNPEHVRIVFWFDN